MREAGFYREDFKVGEDYEYHLRVCKLGPVAFIDSPLVRYTIEMRDAMTTNYSLNVALNFTHVLESTLRSDRPRIQLPEKWIKDCKADAYAWVAREFFYIGDDSWSRLFAKKSLKHKWFQPEMFKLIGASFLPSPARNAILSFKRSLVSYASRLSHSNPASRMG